MVASLVVRRCGAALTARPLLESAVQRSRLYDGTRAFSLAATSSLSRPRVDLAVFKQVCKPTLLAGVLLSSSSRNFSFGPSQPPAEIGATEVRNHAQSSAPHIATTNDAISSSSIQPGLTATDASSSLSNPLDAGSSIHGSIPNPDVVQPWTTDAAESAMGIIPGELSALGLNNMTSPVGWVINIFEQVGGITSLPWWATIAFTTIIVRLCLAKSNIAGQKNGITLANHAPEMKIMMEEVKAAKLAGDSARMQRGVAQVQAMFARTGANPFKSIVPILIQLPVSMSIFFALERLAGSACYSFSHGGIAWFHNLAVVDPTWILPGVSTVLTLAVIEMNFFFGGAPTADPFQMKLMKYIARGSLPLIAYFSAQFPAGLLVYWVTTNAYTLVQLLILRIPAVRKAVRFPKRIEHPVNPFAAKPKGFLAEIKERTAAAANPTANIATPIHAKSAKTLAQSRDVALNELLEDNNSNPASAAAAAAVKTVKSPAQRKNQRIVQARQRKGH